MSTTQQVSFGKGSGIISRWNCDDIQIGHALSKFSEPTTFPAGREDDVVRLHFGLSGDYDFHHVQLNQSFDSVGGRQNIMYSQGFNITVQTKSAELETFGIQFPKELFVHYTQGASDPLQRFCEAILEGKSSLLSNQWPIVDLATRKVIHEIRQCKYAGNMRKLFLLSKSIELLVLSAEAHDLSKKGKSLFIKNNSDKEKIMAARDLVSHSMQDPPHLNELARLVGINEYKLKGGFKELFNMTVYGYIREQRLLSAYQYLLDTELSAAQIAMQLGYSSPQHFNNAFKKRFGNTPSAIRKNP